MAFDLYQHVTDTIIASLEAGTAAWRKPWTGDTGGAAFPRRAEGPADASAAIVARRDVWLPEAGGWVSCPVYDRAGLDAGHRIAGPAIVEQMDATTVIPPGMSGRVEPYLNLILEAA